MSPTGAPPVVHDNPDAIDVTGKNQTHGSLTPGDRVRRIHGERRACDERRQQPAALRVSDAGHPAVRQNQPMPAAPHRIRPFGRTASAEEAAAIVAALERFMRATAPPASKSESPSTAGGARPFWRESRTSNRPICPSPG